MELVGWNREWDLLAGWLSMVVLLLVTNFSEQIQNYSNLNSSFGVQLRMKNENKVVMDNNIVQVTLSIPDGDVIEIQFYGIQNILEARNEERNRGYWDVVWSQPGNRNHFDKLIGTEFKIIKEDEDQVELSFVKKWDFSDSELPLNFDKRYVMLRGNSGFYSYAMLERRAGWPDVDIDQIRSVFKLRQDKFQYMAVSDDRQRMMPTEEDRETGKVLAYREAVLVTNSGRQELRGQVDDKYQYSVEHKGNNVHGWICLDPPFGFWMVTPSDEFRAAGPTKQELTSHVGPTTLSMFSSTHYAGKEASMKFRNGESWKKVHGPVFVYLNSALPQQNPIQLWQDAKQQMLIEMESWPYDFPVSEDFPHSDQRGQVAGQLLIKDRFISERVMMAESANVGLALPGEIGSWQTESKGYQFWTETDKNGYFLIKNVHAGVYNLYAWVPGIIGDYKYHTNITIQPGSKIRLGVLEYEPPRDGPTLWEIGIPDRSAKEFYVPEPYLSLTNQLYNHHSDKFRQYGLWDRYADLYPHQDLVFTIGVSHYSQDWFYAHVTRKTINGTYKGTTWEIKFQLEKVIPKGIYKLRLALASATESVLEIRINNPNTKNATFSTGRIGKDNAIARHGIHGLYHLYHIDVPGNLLSNGNNSIFLSQSRSQSPFQGIMYDYIRLEHPLDSNL